MLSPLYVPPPRLPLRVQLTLLASSHGLLPGSGTIQSPLVGTEAEGPAQAYLYSGFRSLLVQGERSTVSAFLANRILAFMPERRAVLVLMPLRKLDYFEDYAILRDRRGRLGRGSAAPPC